MTIDKDAELGRAIDALVLKSELLMIFYHDGEYTVNVALADGRRTGFGNRLLDAILSLHGAEPVKRCAKCRQIKPASQFSLDSGLNRSDAKFPYCRWCNAARVSAGRKRKAAAFRLNGHAAPTRPAQG